ncbi:aspartate--tRNA(Asn) ligase [Candidatus Parcubacteria bacterium]|nr:aspartate--tRNA(Asn) ligase [Candidatus Parcubacteria bacterium]
MRVLSDQLKTHTGRTATVAGWLHKKRAMGGLMFVVLRDRRGLIQVVVQDETEQAKLHGIQNGSVLEVKGAVKDEPRAPAGAEIHDPVVTIVIPVADVPPIEVDKPIDHKPENLDTLFEHRVLNLRNLNERAVFKVQAAAAEALRGYFHRHDFTEIHTPKLLAAATEGGAEVFKLDHFGQTATLAQSPQFYKQMMVGVFERVYEIGPVYRAEPSVTTRHMSEYTSVDAEMGFIEDFQDILDFLSGLLNQVTDEVWKHREADLSALNATRPTLSAKLPQLPLSELHRRFSEATGTDTTKEKDPTPAEERWACQYAAKELGSEAVFITEFPASSMKFYHYRSEHNPEVAERADLLFRGVEIVTASQREHRYDRLVEQLKAAGGDPENPGFRYFLQAFRYGLPPHGGFGLGLERLTQKLVGLNNVKEAALFPRDMSRLAP